MTEVTEQYVPGFEARLVQFARLLRDNGYSVSQRDVGDLCSVMSLEDTLRERRFRQTLQVMFCSSPSEISRFDEIFNAYWNQQVGRKRTLMRQKTASQQVAASREREEGPGQQGSGLAHYFEWRRQQEEDAEETAAEKDPGQSRQAGQSGISTSSRADLGKISDPEEFDKLMALAERLARQMRYRIARRYRKYNKGTVLDLRRTLRHMVQTGGLPVKLRKKFKKRPPVSLLTFVDVSGSMDSYSLFFARFVHALTGGFVKSEAFLFHTRLVHITQTLKEANPIKMMEKLALISQGWSGGTRIGDALATFNKNYARKYTGKRTVAIIMSDGYDTGAPEKLEAELKKLKSRCFRIIWLNPMLGREAYEPSTNAMQKALGQIDVFAPAHNLRSLLLLEKYLANA
ncbi:vWA domain-containing protein [Emcibacter sp.]|uniref:vWA domain-containing protein n=1 Tax=Emcibacter sp. TaxID=1979954 RepID=UPI002AA6B78D|nr:VWA domain-containing protein [Emcibacter sp.]